MEYIKKLQEFEGANSDKSLKEQFENLANYFLTQGYLLINKTRKVYICDVEFYYHEEDGEIKDWIMYHRNTVDSKGKLKEVDWFDVGQLHAHVSGIDITFEDKLEKKYRAAMLIRGLKIDDTDPNGYEMRSTKIYDALLHYGNIGTGIEIKWKEEPRTGNYKLEEPIFRRNVAEYELRENKHGILRPDKIIFDTKIHTDKNLDKQCEKSKYKQCMRKWRYILK